MSWGEAKDAKINNEKRKPDKLSLTKIKSFHSLKHPVRKWTIRRWTERHYIYTCAHTHTYMAKNWYLWCIKNCHNSIIKRNILPPQKRSKYLNRHFTKDMWIANKHMKKCSISLVIMHCKLKPRDIYQNG